MGVRVGEEVGGEENHRETKYIESRQSQPSVPFCFSLPRVISPQPCATGFASAVSAVDLDNTLTDPTAHRVGYLNGAAMGRFSCESQFLPAGVHQSVTAFAGRQSLKAQEKPPATASPGLKSPGHPFHSLCSPCLGGSTTSDQKLS